MADAFTLPANRSRLLQTIKLGCLALPKQRTLPHYQAKGMYEPPSSIIKGRRSTLILSDTTQGLDPQVTSSLGFDNADPPRPDTLLRTQNHDHAGVSCHCRRGAPMMEYVMPTPSQSLKYLRHPGAPSQVLAVLALA
jgi:hypothetical protein